MKVSAGSKLDMLFRDVEVEARAVDVAVHDGIIHSIEPAGSGTTASEVIGGNGGALIPGLYDHHIHLAALAAANQSLLFDRSFAVNVRKVAEAESASEWIRCVGYHESILGELDRGKLDALVPTRPIRVQHRSGAMWVVNSAGLALLGLSSESGQLFGADSQIRALVPTVPIDLISTARRLADFGVTCVTDLTPSSALEDLEFLAAAATRPDFALCLAVTGSTEVAQASVAGVERGPVKVVVDDYSLPAFDELCESFRLAREARRTVAVHCVTRVGLLLALAVWQELGSQPGDRVEHGAIIPIEAIPQLRELGITVVTQPSFVFERGDQYTSDVDPSEQGDLWRCGSLRAAGIPVGGSTDAPFGDPDPWKAVASATDRTTATGRVLGPDERIDTAAALDMFLTSAGDPGGKVRRVAVGARAELCLLHTPLAEALRDPHSDAVRATMCRSQLFLRDR
jgi:predicted amidohydrolase YtcJ